MKTVKTIITFTIITFILSSCVSDENKALNYVKTEILSEESIETYLMLYNSRIINSEFWEGLEAYLNSISTPCNNTSNYIYLTNGYGNYYERGNSRYCSDRWTFGSQYGYYDSQKILQSIYEQVNEKIELAIINDSIKKYASDECFDKSDDDWGLFQYYMYGLYDYDTDAIAVYNIVLNQAVYCPSYTTGMEYKLNRRGIENTRENREKYQFEWTAKNYKEKQSFIVNLSVFLLQSAVCMVGTNEFKLVDAQGIKTGENKFQVIYLLEPQLKIVFDVTKVGDTFCCDNIEVDGEIDWNIQIDEDDLL